MTWQTPPPEVVIADQLAAQYGGVCPDCFTAFDPFEIRDNGGIPSHDCD